MQYDIYNVLHTYNVMLITLYMVIIGHLYYNECILQYTCTSYLYSTYIYQTFISNMKVTKFELKRNDNYVSERFNKDIYIYIYMYSLH